MTVKACQPCVFYMSGGAVQLFGGRVSARSLGDEPVMRAERVRSVRSSAAAAADRGGVPAAPTAVCTRETILPNFNFHARDNESLY